MSTGSTSFCSRAMLVALGLQGTALAEAPDHRPSEPPAAVAATQGNLTLSRWTIDTGGASNAAGGLFELGATIGQPEAARVSGGPYRLYAGYWVPRRAGGDDLFADGFE
jgi:hypothetical protein